MPLPLPLPPSTTSNESLPYDVSWVSTVVSTALLTPLGTRTEGTTATGAGEGDRGFGLGLRSGEATISARKKAAALAKVEVGSPKSVS